MADDPREIYAVKLAGLWYIASPVHASVYGRGEAAALGKRVWSEIDSTAWLGLEGKEEMKVKPEDDDG